MRHSLLTAALVAGTLLAAAPANAAPSPDIVISEVYGGGGNAGATLHERLRRALQPRHRDGPARRLVGPVRQRDRHGNCVRRLPPRGARARPPASAYLIQRSDGGRRAARPARARRRRRPSRLSGTAGKVALVDQAAGAAVLRQQRHRLAAEQPCHEDLLGYGQRHDSEGAPGPGRATPLAGAMRASSQDTDNNAADFRPQRRARRTARDRARPARRRRARVESSDPADGDADVARGATSP